jgi:hypothetical protein
MPEIVLGVIALLVIIYLLRGFATVNPQALVRAARYAGAAALGLLAIGLFLTERPAAAIFVVSAGWGLFTGGSVWPGGWPHWKRSAPSPGQTSTVRTPWLEMALDHDSGEMRGTILQGTYAGTRLDELDRDTVVELYTTSGDPETRRLLEAWLDRTYGADWRAAQDDAAPPPGRGTTGMTRAEALQVLGLKDGATEEDIRAAHRRLMLQNHPDRGGSDYLASKINEAKDVLLDT